MWIAAIILGLVGLVVLWVILAFGRLIALRSRATAAWKCLDAALKHRQDVVPNLVLAVKSVMDLQPEALIRVIEARNRTMMAGGVRYKAAEEGQLSDALRTFFVLAARHPAMQSSARIRQLLRELMEIEYRLVSVAQSYNALAAALNAAYGTWPAALLTGTLHFQPVPLFAVGAEPSQG